MEQLIRFLPLILGVLQQVPEIRNLVFSFQPGTPSVGQPAPDVVRFLQAGLNIFAGEKLTVDGAYGPATQAALARAATKIAIPLQGKLP